MTMRPAWFLGFVVLAQVLPGCYQRSPWGKCAFGGCLDDSSGSEGDVESSGTGAPSIMTTTDEPTAGEQTGSATGTAGESDTEATTGPAELEPPVIAGMTLTPDPIKSAGIVTVEVEIEDEGAETVTIAVDGGEPAELTPVGDGGTLFTGEIVVFGESWNGDHEVVAVAARGGKLSEPRAEWFEVEAPAAGGEVWLDKGWIVPSYGNAVDADDQGDVLELFTSPTPNGQECFLRRLDGTGTSVWFGGARWIAPFEDCVGEDVKFAPDGTIWVLVNVYKGGFGRWQLWHLDDDGMPLGQTPQIGSLTHMGRGLDVNAAGDVLLCGTWPAIADDDDAWVRFQPQGDGAWTMPWDYVNPVDPMAHKFSERTQDCAFVEDRIVVVGEAWGRHEQHNNVPEFQNRGFTVEFSLTGTELVGVVNSATLAWHSGHHAVASDGEGGYVAVGYNCGAMVTPCNKTQGALRRFLLGATEVKMQPVSKARRLYDVAHSPAGYDIVAAQALQVEQGFLVQGWAGSASEPVLEYQGAKTKLQVATSIAADRVGFILAGGYFQEADDTLVAGVAKVNPY